MTFATAKELPASRRFMLVRITPARYVSDDLVSEGSGVYTMTFAFDNVARVERNGAELTNVETVSSNDDYSFDETTRELTMKLAAAPSSTNVIVVFYSLYYTGDKVRVVGSDPETPESDLRTWEPRLTRYPEIRQSIKNVTFGIFTIDNLNISIINIDNTFQDYLTANDSFYQKDVSIWLCIDDHTNIQKIFQGKVQSLKGSKGVLEISVYDVFSHLKQSALFGDTESEARWRRNADSFPSLFPDAEDTPIPLILGSTSRYAIGQANFSTYYGREPVLDQDHTNLAVCTSYNQTVSVTNNRTWGLCRTLDGVITPTMGSYLSTVFSGGEAFGDDMWAILEFSSDSELSFGDTFKMTGSGDTNYGRVIQGGSPSQTWVSFDNQDPPALSSATYSSFPSVAILIVASDGTMTRPLYDLDYTAHSTQTSGGNYYHYVVFKNDFEAKYSMDPLHPSTHRVFYRVRPDTTNTTHAKILSRMCSGIGLAVNAASFTQADSDLDTQVLFSIPYHMSSNIGTYFDYAEDILASTLGYLILNNDFEIEYRLLSAPSGTSTVDQSTYINDSLSYDIEYGDIATQAIAYNLHNPSKSGLENYTSSSSTATSTKAEHLHGVNKPFRFVHVLEDISDRIDAILAVRSTRRAIYRFETATEHLDTELGDDLVLNSTDILGGSGTDNLQIITLDKGADKTTVEATDLEGL